MDATKGSFAQRMASQALSTTTTVENWDDDGDLQGDFFGGDSTSTAHSISSRVSMRSESNAGDDDWQVLPAPSDDLSTLNAIMSAKQAGIPIPTSVPSSALLGGSIKRLGKKKSSRKMAVDDDWGEDLELPAPGPGGLQLKLKPQMPHTPADEQDFDMDDWGEGSLGIRFGGTRREARGGRASTVSAMSPSMGSCVTFESEDDDMNGLVLPHEPLDFKARLEQLKKTEYPTPEASPLPDAPQKRAPPTSAPAPQLAPPLQLAHAPQLGPAPQLAHAPQLGPAPQLDAAPQLGPSVFPRSEEGDSLCSLPEYMSSPPAAKPKLPGEDDDDDDFLSGLEIKGGDALDASKLTLNRNLVVKKQSPKPAPSPAARAVTTITFSDKPTASRIPRPLPTTRSRLTPVYEQGAPAVVTRQPPTTTSAQLLRAKRSAPMLRNSYSTLSRPAVPFLPAGSSNAQSHHVKSKGSSTHNRRDSDPRRPLSPTMRTSSRMSTINQSLEGSLRAGMRKDIANGPAALAREIATKRPLNRPTLKKAYGDGTELESFDDLPISATKEQQYERVPKNAPVKSLRHLPSSSRLPMPDRMQTPLPQTPKSPPKVDSTPRFARDTAASRNAREQRLAGTRSRGEGPIAPTSINWKAQVAARSPHTSPVAQRKRGTGQKPMLIKAMSAPRPQQEKGMIYNPTLQRWEGNEEALVHFHHPNTSTTSLHLTTASTPTFSPPHRPYHDRSHSLSHTALSSIHAAQKTVSSRAVKVAPVPVPSPPRPALISQKKLPRNIEIQNGMRFDPVKMKWLKVKDENDPTSTNPMDDEDDPFKGIEDLQEKTTPIFGGEELTLADPDLHVGEEFDVGPSFIRRQREEENVWRRRTERWVSEHRDNGETKYDGWRWQFRNLVALASEGNME